MLRLIGAFLVSMMMVVATQSAASAQAPAFEKKNFNYSEWTKGRFSEAVTVTGPGKMIFLAGIGAEDENGEAGAILHKGDFMGQCRYVFDKIKRMLDRHGAKLSDIVRTVTYITDVRTQPDLGRCRAEAYGPNGPYPPNTLLTISQLAWPGMMVEIEVTAIAAQ